MFFFTKNKNKLSEIIPSNYIDIHSHILPGIDDGAQCIEDSKNLIVNLKKLGFSEIITTPHIMHNVWENTAESVMKTYTNTKENCKNELDDLSFNVAAEYMLDAGFIDLLKKGEKLLTLKNNYVLIEMSYLNPPIFLYDILFEIQVAGYKPVLAHPERYSFYHNNLSEYKKIKNTGCLFQLNLLSTVNYYGNEVTKTLDYLLVNDLIDFVGSDIHHQKHIDFFDKKIVCKNHNLLAPIFKNNLVFKN